MRHERLAFLACAALTTPLALDAQPHRYRPDFGPSRPSMDAITRTINDCEDRTDHFRGALRRALNESRIDGSRREEHLNRQAERLERSLDRVGDAWNRDRNPGRARHYVREALGAAREIDLAMQRSRAPGHLGREWRIVREQLRLLANAFELDGPRW